MWLHASLDDVRLARQAAEAGVAVRPLSVTYSAQAPQRRPGLILGFGGYALDKMTQAAQTLAVLIAQSAPGH